MVNYTCLTIWSECEAWKCGLPQHWSAAMWFVMRERSPINTGLSCVPDWNYNICWIWNWRLFLKSNQELNNPVLYGHSGPAPTSALSTGCPLVLSCGWTSTELIFCFTLVTNSLCLSYREIGRKKRQPLGK